MTLSFLAFFALIPPIFYFVTGYRLGQGWSFVETGGLYIGADKSGAEIFVNNNLEKTTNILQNGVFLQGLKPGKYNVVIARDGSWAWSKDLLVKAHLVSEARAFNVLQEPKARILKPEDISALGFSEYDDAQALLNAQKVASKKNATSTEVISKNQKQKIVLENGHKVWAYWLGEDKDTPYYFCDQDNKCQNRVLVLDSRVPVRNIDFYPGRRDVIIYSSLNGVFATEIDGRGGRVTQPVYKGKNPSFALPQAGSGIYVFDDNFLIKLEEI
jgi:hypothetical protein